MPLATWQGPFDAFLPDMSVVRIGEQREVGETELLSSHWQAVSAPTPAAPAISSFSSPLSSASVPSPTTAGEAD